MAKNIKSQKVITEQKCKTCTHPMRDRIEAKRIVDELSYEALRQWCKDELDFDITYVSVRNHFVNHMNEKRELQVRYYDQKYKEQLQGVPDPSNPIEVKLHNIKALDNSITECSVLQAGASLEIQHQLMNKIPEFTKLYNEKGDFIGMQRDDRAKVNTAIVQLLKATSEEIRQSSVAKAQLLGIDEQLLRDEKQGQIVDIIYELTKLEKNNFKDEDESEVVEIQFDDEEEDEKESK